MKNSGEAEGDGAVREQVAEEKLSPVPDNAEAIAWAAASLSTDIGRAVDVSRSVMVRVCSGVLLEANIVK